MFYLLTARLWFEDFGRIREQQRQQEQLREQERQQERLREQQRLFRRTILISNVNITLESFALPNGIRSYLKNEADRLTQRGFVRRTHHSNVEVVCDGTRPQLNAFLDVLRMLHSQTVVESLTIGTAFEQDDHVYSEFSIQTNSHIRCDKNPKSNGEQWEKKSSSVGSNAPYIGGSY